MKFRASNTCYLSCRIWLQNCFPAANVVSVQLEGERGNGALTLLGVLDGLEEGVQQGATSQMRTGPGVPLRLHASKPGFFFSPRDFFFARRRQLVEAGERGVRLTFTARAGAKVALSPTVSKLE